jgi:hypothetical protein
MPKFYVQNASSKTVKVVIEPWADIVELAPEALAEFDYVEPARVGFVLTDDDPEVNVMGDRLELSADGRNEIWEDKTHFFSLHATSGKK